MWGVKEMSRSKRLAQQRDGGPQTGEAGAACSCPWPLSDQGTPGSDLVMGTSFAEATWGWVVDSPRQLLS